MNSKITTKSYSFYCNDLNSFKYTLLHSKAVKLRDFKNTISQTVCQDLLKFSDMSKFDWINHFRTRFSETNNQDISYAITDVHTTYENKFEQLKKNSVAILQKYIHIEYYQRNTKNNSKGDTKEFYVEHKSNDLTKVVSFLTRYYSDNIIEYTKDNLDSDPKKKPFRESVLYFYNKFGNRLLDLAKSRQQNILTRLKEHPIVFESLSYRSCTEQKQTILSKNKVKGSVFNAFITLPGQNTPDGKLHIPVKFNKQHHGLISDYDKPPDKKGSKRISYIVCFPKGKIRIVLTKPVKEKSIKNKYDYYGIDTNTKHNLFCDSEKRIIDFERDTLNDYVEFLIKLDKKYSSHKKEKKPLSRRDLEQKTNWMNRFHHMLKRKCRELIDQTTKLGYNHLVVEDLGSFDKSFSRSEEFGGIKWSRLVRLMKLSSLKNYIKSIANKHNIQVTFIQSHYTSQCCFSCGMVYKENRVIQEIFKCVSCGSTGNADAHSASNIEDRLILDVLRYKLLKFSGGVYEPKKVGKHYIKKVLEECYDTTLGIKQWD